MKEFMLLIYNRIDAKSKLTEEKQLEFVNECKLYIEDLQKEGKLISAQPFEKEGRIIRKIPKYWEEENIDDHEYKQVGYYHIYATDLEDAVNIAEKNPEFAFTTNASIYVRPIKTIEERNSFVYPR